MEDASTSTVEFSVSPVLAAGETLTVSFQVAGVATVGAACTGAADYFFPAGVSGPSGDPPTYTFGLSDTVSSFALTVCDDTVDELDETVALTLVTAAGYVPEAPTTHTLMLTDDDVPEVSITSADATATEGGVVTVEVELSTPAPAGGLTVLYQVGAGGGLTAADLTVDGVSSLSLGMNLTLMIAEGQDEADIRLRVVDDTEVDPGETVILSLQESPASYTLAADSDDQTYTLTVTDNDVPALSFTMATGTVGEEGESVTVTVQASPVPAATLTVPVTLDASSTAVLTTDYTLSGLVGSGTLFNIAVTGGSNTFMVTGVSDTLQEGAETVLFRLGADTNDPPRWSLGAQTQYSLTISDDDVVANVPRVSFAQATATAMEDASTSTVEFSVSPVLAAGETLTVSFQEAGVATVGAACTGAADYFFPAGVSGPSGDPPTYTFGLSDTVSSFALTVCDDTVDELDETVALTLVTAAGYVPEAPTTHTLMLTDDDVPEVSITSADATATEGGVVTVEVELSTPAPAGGLTVLYQVGAGGGLTAADLTVDGVSSLSLGMNLTLMIAEGQDEADIRLRVVDDTEVDPGETVMLSLQESTSMSYTLAADSDDQTYTLTVTDNDVPALSFTMATGTVGEEGESVTVTVQASPPATLTGVPVTLDASSTAVLTTDYTLSGLVGTSPDFTIDIPMGGSAMFMVTGVSDTTPEGTETVLFSLMADTNDPPRWSLGARTQYSLTISDNDASTLPQVSFVAATVPAVVEGASTSTSTVEFSVSPSLTVGDTLTVSFRVSGTATPVGTTCMGAADYTFPAGVSGPSGTPPTSTFTLSATLKDFDLTVCDDTEDEPNETVVLTMMTSADYVSGGTVTHTVTIEDNDVPVVSFSVATATANEGGAVQVLVESTTPAPAGGLAVSYSLSGTAGLEVSDFSISGVTPTGVGTNLSGTGTVTIGEGRTSASIDVDLSGDAVSESAETLTLTLTDDTAYDVDSTQNTYAVTIEDTTELAVSFAAASSTLTEGVGTGTVTVNVTPPPSSNLVVGLGLSGGASEGTDYTLSGSALSGASTTRMLTIQADAASASFTVTPRADDNAPVGAETAVFTLQGGAGYAVGTMSTHRLTIEDDDYTVAFAEASSTVTEDAGAAHSIVVEVSPAVRAGDMVSVSVQANPAASANTYSLGGTGVTFSSGSYTLVLGAGATTGTLELTPVDNSVDGADLQVRLSAQALPSGNYVLGGTSAHTVTIEDDEVPVVSFSVATVTADEGGAVQVLVESTTPAPTSGLAVSYSLSGTAGLEASDFSIGGVTPTGVGTGLSGTGTVTILQGMTNARVDVDLSSDTVSESAETLTLTLTDVAAYDVDSTQSTYAVTIRDTTELAVSFAAASSTLTEGGAMGTVTVNVTPPPSSNLVVGLGLSGGASEGMDYTLSGSALSGAGPTRMLTIQANAPNASFTVTPRADDNAPVGAETAVFTLQGGAGYAVGTMSTHRLTIEDDDYTVAFAEASSTVAEDAGAAHTIVVEVSPAVRTLDTVSVSVQASPVASGTTYSLGGTGVTFSSGSYTLALSAGATTGTLELTPVDNSVDGADLQVRLSVLALSSGNYVLGGTSAHTVTIEDDEVPVVSFSVATATADEGGAVQVLVESTTPAPTGGLAVSYSLSGTAGLEAGDFSIGGVTPTGVGTSLTGTGTVTILQGMTRARVDVDLSSDTVSESAETLTLTLTDVAAYDVDSTQSTYAVTIRDTTELAVSFAAASSTLTEGGAMGTVTVNVTPPPSSNLVVGLGLSGGASEGMDYTLSGSALSGAGPTRMLTIQANAPNASFTVTPRADDNAPVGAETAVFTLQGGAGYAVGTMSTHRLTIEDDDYTVAFAEASSTVAEDAGAAHTIVVEVSPAVRTLDTVSVSVQASPVASGTTYSLGGTGVTFSSGSYTLALSAGATTGTLELTPVDNSVDGADLQVRLSVLALSSGNYVLGGTSAHTVTIEDDEVPVVSFSVATATADEGGAVQVLVESTTPAPTGGLAVSYSLSGTAGLEAGDFSIGGVTPTGVGTSLTGTGTVTILQGMTRARVDVDLSSDTVSESAETLTLTLTDVAAYDVDSTQSTYAVTIRDTTELAVSFAAASSTLTEGGAMGTVTVNVTPPPSSNLVVGLGLSGGASEGTDYTLSGSALSGAGPTRMLTIQANAPSASFTVAPRADDNAPVGAETAVFTLQGGAGYAVGTRSTHRLTIEDDDYTVSFAEASSTVAEDAGTAHTIVVEVSPAVRTLDTVSVSVQANPAASASTYSLGGTGVTGSGGSYTLVLGAGATTGTLELTPMDNNVDGADLQVRLSAQAGSNYVLGGTSAHAVTIEDDDVPVVSFSVATATADEGDTVQVLVESTTPAPTGGLVVSYSLSGTTGLEASDFSISGVTPTGTGTGLSGTGTVTIGVGRTNARIDVDLSSDTVSESAETLTLTLTDDTAYDVDSTQNTYAVTIEDTTELAVSFAAARTTVEEGDAAVMVEVNVTSPPSEDLVVSLRVSGGASVGTDYTLSGLTGAGATRMLTIASGSDSATFTVTPRTEDSAPEGAATAVFTLQGGAEYAVGAMSTHRLTIEDDDYTVQFAEASSEVAEGEAADTEVHNIVVEVTPAVRTGGTVSVSVQANPAASGTTYSLGGTGVTGSGGSYTLALSAGATTGTLELDPVGNDVDGADLQVRLRAQAGTNYVLGGTNAHTVTIEDDDAPVVSFSVATVTADEGATVQVQVESTTPAPTGGLAVSYSLSGTAGLEAGDFSISGVTPTGTGTGLSGTGTVTIGVGRTNARIDVDLSSDTVSESAETLTLTLTDGAAYDVDSTQNTYAVTIEDTTELAVSFAAARTTVEEGDAAVMVEVNVTSPPSEDLVVSLRVSGGASVGTDYTLSGLAGAGATRMLTIASGSDSATFTVTPRAEDNAPVGAETAVFTLQGGAGYAVGTRSTHRLTIEDDDYTVQFAEASSDVAEDASAAHNIVVEVSPAVRTGDTVSVRVQASPAASGTTYSLGGTGVTGSGGSYTLALSAGATTGTLELDPVDNDVDGADLQVRLSAQAGTNYVLGGTSEHTVTITDDEALLVSFRRNPASQTVMEGGGGVNVAVQLSTAAPTGGLTVHYQLQGRTAGLTSSDFSITGVTPTGSGTNLSGTGTVRINARSRTANIQITINTDSTDEMNETLRLVLVDRDDYDLGTRTQFDLTIDDGDQPQLSFSPRTRSVAEASGATTVTVNVSPSPVSALSVDLTLSGSRATLGTHYGVGGLGGTGTTRTLAIAASAASATFTITPTDDATPGEANRVVEVNLAGGAGYGVSAGTNPYQLTIQDDDYGLGFDSASSSAMENAGTVQVQLRAASRPANAAQRSTFTARVSITSDTADAGVDFNPGSGLTEVTGEEDVYELTIAADGSATVPLALVNNSVTDEARVIELTLQTLTDGRYTPSGNVTHSLTINDDDSISVSFSSITQTSIAEGSMTSLSISASARVSAVLPINVCVAGGMGVVMGDYSIAGFTRGSGSDACGGGRLVDRGSISLQRNANQRDFSITMTDDTVTEEDEELTLRLEAGEGYSVGSTDSVTLTIPRNDQIEVSFAMARSTAAEDAGTRTVRVTANRAPSSALDVAYTLGGSATGGGSDYTITGVSGNSGSVRINSGNTSANIQVQIIDDSDGENQETLTLTLSNPSGGAGYALGSRSRHTLAITDNDGGAPPPSADDPVTVWIQGAKDGRGASGQWDWMDWASYRSRVSGAAREASGYPLYMGFSYYPDEDIPVSVSKSGTAEAAFNVGSTWSIPSTATQRSDHTLHLSEQPNFRCMEF